MEKISGGNNTTWFCTMKRCPACKAKQMMGNGQGSYYCNECGYNEGDMGPEAKYKEQEIIIEEPGWYV